MIILDDKTNFGFVGLLRTRDTALIFYKVVEPYLKRVGGGPVETVRFDGRLGIPRSVPVHIDSLMFNSGGRVTRSGTREATNVERQVLPVGTIMMADTPISDDEADLDRARALHAQALELVRVRRSLAPACPETLVPDSLLATFMAYKYVEE
ncbi:hypothetical protein CVT24_002846, partial [Panaeolus cyanescens]